MAKRILVVEDEPDIRATFRALLESHGYEVDEAENGAVALQKLANGLYDLMFLDLLMPEVDGYETLARMAPELRQRLPVVIATAKTQDADLLRSYGMGAAYFVNKPVRNRTVVNIVRYLIGDLTEEQKEHLERYL